MTQRNYQMAKKPIKNGIWCFDTEEDSCMTAQVLEDMLNGGENREGIPPEYTPEKLRTAELCLAAVRRRGWALQYVPEEHKTAKLCLAAVHQYSDALQYVPENLKEQVKEAEGKERPDITLYDFVGKNEEDLFINTKELDNG